MKYIFILGQSPDLAKQEILSILANDSEKIITISQNFILAESDKSSDQLI